MASLPSKPTAADSSISMLRHLPEAQLEHLFLIVIACSSTTLILSLRAAGEIYICAALACDLGSEIEVKEPAF